MGWRLAEEIAWARPERPGPEWWTLMDIAQDARDETRQGMPGMDYLTARGKCSRRTLYRRLDALRDAGLLTVARRPAPGVRAIYRIPVIHRLPETGASIGGIREPVDNPETGAKIADTRPPVDNSCTGASVSGTRTEPNGCQNEAQRVPLLALTSATPLRGTHSVSTTPSYNPVNYEAPVDGGSVEGAQLSTGEPSGAEIISSQPAAATSWRGRWRDPAERALQQAAEARAARLAREA